MQRYRVECNFGSRYFPDMKKAGAYYNKCKAKHLDAELWQVNYIYCFGEYEDRVLASQVLIAYSGTNLPKS